MTLPKTYDECLELSRHVEYKQKGIKREALREQLRNYKEQAANVSLVIDTILDTVEKRYDMAKQEKHDS